MRRLINSGEWNGSSLSIGLDLQRAFRAQSVGARSEVSLFRAFIRSFRTVGTEVLAREYHGARYQVEFKQSRGAGRPYPRCELCDVLIIQYQAGNPSGARMTVNQAKVTAKSLGCVDTTSTGTPKTFKANLEQWDLLANRPDVAPVTRKFRPPGSLLSGATLPSIGSFGVFYPVAGGAFEFAYFVAELLSPIRNNPGRFGTLAWCTPFLQCRNFSGFEEVTGTCCLPMFGEALTNGLVGTPVRELLRTPADTVDLKSWLARLLTNLEREHPDSEIPRELLQGLELQGVAEHLADPVDSASAPPIKAAVVVRTGRTEYQSEANKAMDPTR